MIKMEHIRVSGFEAALRGMRNAMNSWSRADSTYDIYGNLLELGPNDRQLLLGLTKAGASHRKALRMFHIQLDVTAPLYWWKDYDTYKVATVANSCSTMHKIHDKEFELDQFAHDQLDDIGLNLLKMKIEALNAYRKKFLDSGKKDKQSWYCMIQLLETSYLQKRTIDLNYETALMLIMDRRNHKLNEFREFVQYLIFWLPLMDDLVDVLDKK